MGQFKDAHSHLLPLCVSPGAGVSAGTSGGPGVRLQGCREQPDRAGVRGHQSQTETRALTTDTRYKP